MPSVIWWAWSALIICMSHCSASRGSAAAAAVGLAADVAVDVGLRGVLLVAGRAAGPRATARPRGVPSETGDGAGGADGLHGVAGGSAATSARNAEAVGVRDDDADLRPGLHDDAAGARRRPARPAGLAGVGDPGVDEVARDDAVRGGDRDGGGGGLLGAWAAVAVAWTVSRAVARATPAATDAAVRRRFRRWAWTTWIDLSEMTPRGGAVGVRPAAILASTREK